MEGTCSKCVFPRRQDEYIGYGAETTSLMHAAFRGYKRCVKELIRAGADVNVTDEDGDGALFYAAVGGQLVAATRNNNNAEGADATEDECSASPNHDVCVRLLTDAGADVNSDSDNEWTALTKAAFCGNYKTVEILLRAGANVNEIKKNGFTPLIDSVASTKKASYELLESAAAVFAPVYYSREKCASLLLKAGADVNATNKYGESALIYAIANGHDKCVDVLLEAGADVNVVSKRGNTALHYCIAANQVHVMQKLLGAEAQINMINNNCHNALQQMIAWGDPEDHPEMLLMAFAAGEILNTSHVQKETVSVPVPEYLLHKGVKLQLKHICRETIRKHLIELDPYAHLFHRIPKLEGELPLSLIHYLLFYMSIKKKYNDLEEEDVTYDDIGFGNIRCDFSDDDDDDDDDDYALDNDAEDNADVDDAENVWDERAKCIKGTERDVKSNEGHSECPKLCCNLM